MEEIEPGGLEAFVMRSPLAAVLVATATADVAKLRAAVPSKCALAYLDASKRGEGDSTVLEVYADGTKIASCGSPEEVEAAFSRADAEKSDSVQQAVRRAYAETATGGASVLPGNCGDIETRRGLLGYSDEYELHKDADLGLGCGNPLSVASLKPGEIVLDLGSGAGVDCFAAAKQVGPAGRVIGVDMTPEMLDKARKLARGYPTVSFRLGEIEHLPCGDSVVDCVISNCVINLSVDKPQVYREMARVLKPGGRVAISDVLRKEELPASLKSEQSYSC
ncbi:hypothetical protein CTAYLR_002244 [Chrysophaeum taylorii]|uniref:Arsenite methyltransferase n=1 Tax=Chrysophaeum taylorii TaxID=2483200 RepID=A0AAD7UMZ8_9STRA|nr:hypothetical protein CTAYLR_002244 [Chrysophaeum taylorii]